MQPPANVLQHIARHIDLEPAEEKCFLDMLSPRSLKARELLLDEGEVCRHSAFVTRGCLRGYTIDQNGYEHVLQFAPPNWWIADMYSLITQKPGTLIIEALEDSEVLLLSKTDQEQLYRDVPQFERFFRIITENSLVTNRQRVLDNLSLTASQRYEAFCHRYPTLIDTLPQKQIAAYIGVTPEFFSKMKAGLKK
ncbi:MAG: Crp/Fnr family transcriptional regulator [Bacteroidia bacterium]|jgi:CRP-like cAMP-binding protein|nr:Crp/Fnr family transcriptional regulator [Bacteroidia bacterium]